MNPDIPVTVWEQIPVVVLFAVLLAGIGLLFIKSFKESITDINKYYAAVIEHNNDQWQKYFDARSQSNDLVNKQIVEQLGNLTKIIETLSESFNAHDLMERQALDEMAGKRRLRK